MVKKLTSLLTAQTKWNLLFRPALLSLTLLLIALFGFKALLVLAYAAAALSFYWRILKEKPPLRWHFLVLASFFPVLIPAAQSLFPPLNLVSLVLIILGIGFLAWLILSVLELNFSDQAAAYEAVFSFELLVLFLGLFYLSSFPPLGLVGVLAALVMFKVFQESLSFYFPDGPKASLNLPAGVLTLIGLEILWFANLLPIETVNLAVLAVIFASVARSLTLAGLRRRLSTEFILKEATLLVLSTVIIFALSHWTLR